MAQFPVNKKNIPDGILMNGGCDSSPSNFSCSENKKSMVVSISHKKESGQHLGE